MIHAGEILFAAAIAGTKQVILIGEANQIPYINRIETIEVKYYNIAEISMGSKHHFQMHKKHCSHSLKILQTRNEDNNSHGMRTQGTTLPQDPDSKDHQTTTNTNTWSSNKLRKKNLVSCDTKHP